MIAVEIIIAVTAVIISGIAALVSWYFSRRAKEHADIVLLNQYISEAVKEFKEKETPVNYIRSLVLPNNKKEIVWKYCYLRYKSRWPDSLFSDMPPPTSYVALSFEKYIPIIKALGSGQFEDRTVKSISKEIAMDKEFIQKGLQWFFDNELVKKRTASDGTYWSLTEKGWKACKKT